MNTLTQMGIVLGAAVSVAVAVAMAQGVPPDPSVSAPVACGADLPTDFALRWITAEEAGKLRSQGGAVFVDAREAGAFERGHVAGAVHVPIVRGVIREGDLESIRGAPTIITYCDGEEQCSLSVRLAGLLVEAGLGDVRVLQDGFAAWVEGGHPAEAGTCHDCP
ncbi:MAG: rhodanese-like domain-containing protein [Myxococcales bacterium]|nr:rhodanese-like domain-containing protein [Myxococcales bacterium]